MAVKKNRSQMKDSAMDKSIYPSILRYGVIGGILIVLIGIVQSKVLGQIASEGTSSTSFLPIILILVGDIVIILMMIMAITAYKKSNNGFASFGKAFLTTFLTSLLIAFLSWLVTLLLVYLGGLPGTTMGLDRIDTADNGFIIPFFQILAGAIPSLLSNCVFGGFMALIISLVTKKPRPAVL